MLFRKLRETNKILIIFIALTFVAAGLFVGITSLTGGKNSNTMPGYDGLYADSKLLTVNGETVPAKDFFQVLQNYYDHLHLLPTEEVVDLQNGIVYYLIERTVMGQEAKRRGIKATVTEEEIQKIFDDYLEANNITMAEFEKQLVAVGDSLTKSRARVKEGLLEQNLLAAVENSIRDEVNITDEEIIREYEKVRAGEIFIEFSNEDAESKEKLERARIRLVNGEDFASVAADFTDDYNEEMWGKDLGLFTRDSELDPILIDYAFKTPAGQVTEIFTTEDGYHILKIEERSYAEGEEYLEAKEELAEELLALKQYNHFRDTLNNLSYGADVEIHNPALAGYFWYRRGEFAKSVKNLGPIAKDIGDNAVLLDILANAYFLTGDGKKALEVFEDAIKDSPTNWELRLAYADFTGKLGDYDTAEIHLQAVIDGAYDDYDEMVKLLPHIKRLGSREQITQVTNIVEEFEKEFETEVDLE